MKKILSWFSPAFSQSLVYMLQSTEYDPKEYIKWFWRSKDIRSVATRKTLDKTRVARLLLLAVRSSQSLLLLGAAVLVWFGVTGSAWLLFFGGMLFVLQPLVVAHGVLVVVVLGRWFVVRPKIRRMSRNAEKIFRNHPGTTIVIAGSYGKTTMKELLYEVLSKDFTVAASPGNRNVAFAHSQLASNLKGNEDILLVEFGEGAPGDVEEFAKMTHPDMAIITGLAPVHLDEYKTLETAARDILSLSDFVDSNNLFLNGDSTYLVQYLLDEGKNLYTNQEVFGWRISDVDISIKQTSFTLEKQKHKLQLVTQLIGGHQVGPVAFAAALATRFNMPVERIEEAVARTHPFPHRMNPYKLHDAWIVDDTYNGNIEGMRAGLKLLNELEATRKIYVTPGLVGQGDISENIHTELGQAIAHTNPDIVYLMSNSVTAFIQEGLRAENYQGKCVVIEEPLVFYGNLDNYVAAGDLVLMQNDWTDNYY